MAAHTTGEMTFRWLLDVRSRWRDDFPQQAVPELALLPASTHSAILAFHFTKDRAMALGSNLLKYHAIHTATALPYASISLSRDPATRKPIFQPPSPSTPEISFNVSHQAGLVALIGSTGPRPRAVGIDIVCVNERNEIDRISSAGQETNDDAAFADWVDMHSEVFSAAELDDIKIWHPSPEASSSSSLRSRSHLEQRLRRFYTFWALKEAYIKLKGEALLAPWLKDLEFRHVRVPPPAEEGEGLESATGDGAGRIAQDVQVWFRGTMVRDVKMELRAVESRYMIATAVQVYETDLTEREHVGLFPAFEVLDLEEFQRAGHSTA